MPSKASRPWILILVSRGWERKTSRLFMRPWGGKRLLAAVRPAENLVQMRARATCGMLCPKSNRGGLHANTHPVRRVGGPVGCRDAFRRSQRASAAGLEDRRHLRQGERSGTVRSLRRRSAQGRERELAIHPRPDQAGLPGAAEIAARPELAPAVG